LPSWAYAAASTASSNMLVSKRLVPVFMLSLFY
jgi:hypothetical protein